MKAIIYAKAERVLFVINTEQIIPKTPTVIFHYELSGGDNIEVKYNYDCAPNTYRREQGYQRISKEEFNEAIKEIQKRNGIKFSIKLR